MFYHVQSSQPPHEVGTVIILLTGEKTEAQGHMEEEYDITKHIKKKKSGLTQRTDWLAEEVVFSNGTTGLSIRNNV